MNGVLKGSWRNDNRKHAKTIWIPLNIKISFEAEGKGLPRMDEAKQTSKEE